MRLLKIGVYYPIYLSQFYSDRPDLSSASYEKQHAALMADCFGSSNFWTTALSNLGYETADITANAEPLQKQWAREHEFVFDDSSWLFEITAAQVKAFQPEVLIVADYTTVTAEFLSHLRSICPSIRLVLGWCGAPYQDDSVFHQFDIVLSCVPELIERFQQEGHESRHVNHAFAPRILDKMQDGDHSTVNFSFIGSIVKSDHFHLGREKLLAALVRQTDLRIWSNAARAAREVPADQQNLRQQIASLPLVGPIARASRSLFSNRRPPDAPGIDPEILSRAKAPLFGLKMFQQLRDSRVTLNNHIDVSIQNASNMRLFEATGVGTCLLTDWKVNLPGLFEDSLEVVSYRDPDDCIEKVKYLLDHDSERRAIAQAGQRRTLRDHTFAARAQQIDAIVREALAT